MFYYLTKRIPYFRRVLAFRKRLSKDLKGKELGVGISQRKDGLYTARIVSKRSGKTVQKYFQKQQECRKWYADATIESALKIV